jgi:hypothetical protein
MRKPGCSSKPTTRWRPATEALRRYSSDVDGLSYCLRCGTLDRDRRSGAPDAATEAKRLSVTPYLTGETLSIAAAFARSRRIPDES